MQSLKKRFKKNPMLLSILTAAAAMVLILLAVFLIMDAAAPGIPSAQQVTLLEPERPIPYSADDFVQNKDGFMECISIPFSTGIDVSLFQGEIDWQNVKADGVEFVFIRVGGRGTTDGGLYTDSKAQEYYRAAKAAGLQVGAYFFSQAISEAEAREEAVFALKQVKKWELDLPFVYDWEWAEKAPVPTG